MSIQEKKTQKGTPYAIGKFSDKLGEFELFIFSENLIRNREKLKESESFILNLQKENDKNDGSLTRINLKALLSLNELVEKSYENISIELSENYDLKDLNKSLKEKGETKIKIIIPENKKKLVFNLEDRRKFDFSLYNEVKSKEYVKKISF